MFRGLVRGTDADSAMATNSGFSKSQRNLVRAPRRWLAGTASPNAFCADGSRSSQRHRQSSSPCRSRIRMQRRPPGRPCHDDPASSEREGPPHRWSCHVGPGRPVTRSVHRTPVRVPGPYQGQSHQRTSIGITSGFTSQPLGAPLPLPRRRPHRARHQHRRTGYPPSYARPQKPPVRWIDGRAAPWATVCSLSPPQSSTTSSPSPTSGTCWNACPTDTP